MKQQGFTLIEILVALVIVAIALVAVTRATIVSTKDLSYLKDKSIAHWVGLNIISEVQTGLLPIKSQKGQTTMFEKKWMWRINFVATKFKKIDKITVVVSDQKQELDQVSVFLGDNYD